MKVLAAAVAALALAVTPASAADAANPRLSRPTFIDPEVVSQLPRDLTDRMVRDGESFYVPDSTAETRTVVGTPKRMRFMENKATAAAHAKAPTPVVAPHRSQPAEEPRRPTNRSPADDARRRRDFEAWEMRRQELGAQQVEQQLQQDPSLSAARFAEAAPAPAPAAAAVDDDGDDGDEDLTPAQLQLEAQQRRAAAAAKAQAAAQASAAATRTAAMRFAEARRAGRPLVQAYPPPSDRGTTDLAGHVMQSRLQRAASRAAERDAADERERAQEQPVVMLETGAATERRHMFQMTPEELRAAFRAHRRGQAAVPGSVRDRVHSREEAGPADMPPMAEAPAAPAQTAPVMIEEHGLRVTHYEPFRRS